MAEFAAASSAVGIVSLGLTVCSGLIKYCRGFKDFDDHARTAVSGIERLSSLLEVLSNVLSLSGLESRPSHRTATTCINDCAESITALEAVWKRCLQKPGSTGLPRQFHRVVYPFRKPEITALQTTLGQLQADLMIALQTLQWYAPCLCHVVGK